MPTQIEKLEAYADHLLDGFIGLREKYAMLEPMLFDTKVRNFWDSYAQAWGFTILRYTLFLSCIQDIANLTLDSDPRTPSIRNIACALQDSSLRDQLRERHAVWYSPLAENEHDPEMLAALEKEREREKSKPRTQFDEHYARLVSLWGSLSSSPVLRTFKMLRDKAAAHNEVHLVSGEYRLVDIDTLGIRWKDLKDLKETITTMQQVVRVIGFLVRDADFAWDSFDDQLTKAAAGFWRQSIQVR
ncbi:MAG: hypothetical protein M3120_04345 [Pseudomonadota bacterium]|nr:hypothetical protein [Pseudomonadota bacterium]